MSKENKQIINSADLGLLISENTASSSFIEPEENDQLLSQGVEPEIFSPIQPIQWVCSCGAVNIGSSCSNCGASKK